MSARVSLQARVEQYLAERRRVGFDLSTMGHGLASFARHVQAVEHRGPLTVDLMAAWARLAKGGHGDRATSARRLKMLRPFTSWLRQFEPATEVPDEAVFGAVPGRMTPHVYREPEIIELLAAARQIGPDGGLRPVVMETLFGLIACTGLRISEALGLLDVDVNLQAGVLTIRQSKFGKSRLVPLHPSAIEALARVPNAARPACAQHARIAVLRRQPWALAGSTHRGSASSPRLRRAATATRLGRSWQPRYAAHPRPAPQLRRASAGALARAGRGRQPADPGVVDLPRPRQGLQHLLVHHRRTGVDGPAGPALRALRQSLGGWR